MIDAYLRRIGLTRGDVGALDRDALRRLALVHTATVPFDNTRVHRGEPISVRIDEVLDRLVRRRGGGLCYELNGGLGWLLGELGAPVRMIGAQVLVGAEGAPASPGLPLGHMALLVTTPKDGETLVDVGFGSGPIVRDVPHDGTDVVTERGTSYRVDAAPRSLEDFAGMAWWHSTSPDSRFMRGVIVTTTGPEGIATLSSRGESHLQWRYRGVRDELPRDVEPAEAQAIAEQVFGLAAPLPQQLLRYAAVAP